MPPSRKKKVTDKTACWGGILARSPCDHVKSEDAPSGGDNYCEKHRNELLIPEEYVQEATPEEVGAKWTNPQGTEPWCRARIEGSKCVGKVFKSHKGAPIFVRRPSSPAATAVAIADAGEPTASGSPSSAPAADPVAILIAPSESASAVTSTQTLEGKRPEWFKNCHLVLKFCLRKHTFVPCDSNGSGSAGPSKQPDEDNGDGGAASVAGSVRRGKRKRRSDAPDDRQPKKGGPAPRDDCSSDTTSLVSSGRQQQPSLSATFTVRDEDLLGLLASCLRIGDPAPLEGVVQKLDGLEGVLFLLDSSNTQSLGLPDEDSWRLRLWQEQTAKVPSALGSSSAELHAALRTMFDTYLCKTLDASGLSVEWQGTCFTLRLDDEKRPLPSSLGERDTLRARLEGALRRLSGIEGLTVSLGEGSILVHCRCRASEIPAAILSLSGGALCGYPVIAFDDGTPSPRVDSYEFDVRAPVQVLQALRALVEPAGALLGPEQPLSEEMDVEEAPPPPSREPPRVDAEEERQLAQALAISKQDGEAPRLEAPPAAEPGGEGPGARICASAPSDLAPIIAPPSCHVSFHPPAMPSLCRDAHCTLLICPVPFPRPQCPSQRLRSQARPASRRRLTPALPLLRLAKRRRMSRRRRLLLQRRTR